MAESTITREAWLLNALEILRFMFADKGWAFPENIRISVGFGYGARAENGKILGQAWNSKTSADGVPTIFVSPEIDDPFEVVGVLVHEVAHLVDDCQHGHRKEFVRIADSMGLIGIPTQTFPGPDLGLEILTRMEVFGGYPHVKLNVDTVRTREHVPAPSGGGGARTGPKTQRSRHHSWHCVNEGCGTAAQGGWRTSTSRRWSDVAKPVCPVCLSILDQA